MTQQAQPNIFRGARRDMMEALGRLETGIGLLQGVSKAIKKNGGAGTDTAIELGRAFQEFAIVAFLTDSQWPLQWGAEIDDIIAAYKARQRAREAEDVGPAPETSGEGGASSAWPEERPSGQYGLVQYEQDAGDGEDAPEEPADGDETGSPEEPEFE